MVLGRSFKGREVLRAWPCFWRWRWFAQAECPLSTAAEPAAGEPGAEAVERHRMSAPKAGMVRARRQGLAQERRQVRARSFWPFIITAG